MKQIYEMRGAGHSTRAIARELGLARNTVLRYLKSPEATGSPDPLIELTNRLCELDRVEQALSKAGPWRSRGRRFRGLGILVQIDGSHHRWLDEQGPQFTLLLVVDGTTSAVVNAVFRPEEDTRGYFVLMQGLIQR